VVFTLTVFKKWNSVPSTAISNQLIFRVIQIKSAESVHIFKSNFIKLEITVSIMNTVARSTFNLFIFRLRCLIWCLSDKDIGIPKTGIIPGDLKGEEVEDRKRKRLSILI
jgi:hypothetical protein